MVLSAELDTTVSEVYKDGSARIEQVFTRYGFDATGDPTVDAELAAASEPFVGLSMWTIIDDRGFVLDAGIDDLDTLTPEFGEQVRDTSGTATVLPAEAVGLGARWVADGTVVSQGVPVAMTVEPSMGFLLLMGMRVWPLE